MSSQTRPSTNKEIPLSVTMQGEGFSSRQEIDYKLMAKDPVNPSYYQGDRVMRIIEDFNLGFRLGSVVKYILRESNKNGLQDLRKALWYLEREIAKREEDGIR